MGKVMLDCYEVDFEACVALMDDDIREELLMEMAWDCTEQEFFGAYCKRHFEEYGEDFEP